MKKPFLSKVLLAFAFSPVAVSFQPPRRAGPLQEVYHDVFSHTTSRRLKFQDYSQPHRKLRTPTTIISPPQTPVSSLRANNLGGDDDITSSYQSTNNTNLGGKFGFFCIVSFLYWYLMVFGAAAATNGLPVPDFIPMIPGWPANEADFQDVLEDSYHFFYLSELLQNNDAPYVAAPRLAVFNFVEAWIFAFLPILWKDPKRLPRPVLLSSWAILGINLTNAFLAPYLAITEFLGRQGGGGGKLDQAEAPFPKNQIFSISFGTIALLVVAYASYQSAFIATGSEWKEFFDLAASNRTYLAFCVDPIVLAIFQPLVLARVRNGDEEMKPLDYVPFVGTIAWLLSNGEDN